MSRLILFYGADPYLLDTRAQAYIRERIPAEVREWEVETIDGQTAELDRILIAADALPFLHERRLTWVRRPAFASAKQRGGMTADQKKMLAYLETADPTNDLVFTVLTDGNLSAFLKKCLALAEAHRCDPLEGRALHDYADELAGACGRVLARDAHAYLDRHLGLLDAATLAGELEKTFLYWEAERQLGERHLAAVFSLPPEANVFQMIDAILAGRPRQALALWEALAATGESPSSLRYMLADQLRTIIAAKALDGEGLTPKAMAERLGKHPYVLKKSLPLARRHSDRALVAAYSYLVDAMIASRQTSATSEACRFVETIIGTAARMKE